MKGISSHGGGAEDSGHFSNKHVTSSHMLIIKQAYTDGELTFS